MDECYCTDNSVCRKKYEKIEAENYILRAVAEKIDKLEDLIRIQCSDGNWNYDHYMHGMANGMLLMLSVVSDTEPKFLSAPKRWLTNARNS